jgi:UDP-N-acetylmuramoyl-L-alanyl-D-glutamate--2,6-diaminopimelate ligase
LDHRRRDDVSWDHRTPQFAPGRDVTGDQGRVAGVAFDVAVLTNLSLDHLDYHGSMEAYGAAKRRLFALPGIGAAVLNLDDPFGVDVAQRLAGSGIQRIGFGLEEARSDCADRTLVARDLDFAGHGLRFAVDGVAFAAPVVGRFNVSNLLAVIGVLLAGGVSLSDAAAAIAAIEAPPGRMQALGGRGEPLLVVDYAHTPDALEKALLTLRDTARSRGGRLLCVFGCGGERDHAKRPVMGGIAVRYADSVWITSDNPRGEDAAAIIAEILAGTGGEPNVEVDRAAAVTAAVAAATAADVVLVAGKGHEAYQEMAGVRHPYSDVEQALAALAAWRSRR